MSGQITGPLLCEVDNSSFSGEGTVQQVGANLVLFSDQNDIHLLQVGSLVVFDGDPTEYRLLHIDAGTSQGRLDADPGLIGSVSFTFTRMPFVVRQRIEVADEKLGTTYTETLQSYVAKDGLYHSNENAQSGCLLSGKNAASQSLTADTRTLVEWDSGLVWTNPKDEWGGGGTTPNLFSPKESGYYSIWASLSILATTSVVGDQVRGEVSLDGWADQYIMVVHQRPDLDFIGTYRRNVDLQCLALIAAGQSLGIYITSECGVSEISNNYTQHFAAWRIGDSLVVPPPAAS